MLLKYKFYFKHEYYLRAFTVVYRPLNSDANGWYRYIYIGCVKLLQVKYLSKK